MTQVSSSLREVIELRDDVRARYPDIAAKADRFHARLWGAPGSQTDAPFQWFESLANALNAEMSAEVDPNVHRPLLLFLTGAMTRSEHVAHCVDVAFTENLFWQIPAPKREGYWRALPPRLQALYIAFHRRPPVP